MHPLGWGWAGLVWAYALFWFLVEDRAKLAAYQIFHPLEGGLLIKKRRR
jgi:H+-transporting ATPase